MSAIELHSIASQAREVVLRKQLHQTILPSPRDGNSRTALGEVSNRFRVAHQPRVVLAQEVHRPRSTAREDVVWTCYDTWRDAKLKGVHNDTSDGVEVYKPEGVGALVL